MLLAHARAQRLPLFALLLTRLPARSAPCLARGLSAAPDAAPSAPPPPPLLPPAPLPPAEGVPLQPGEVLVHTAGGGSTSSMVRQSWLPTLLCSAYLAVVKGVEAYTPHLDALLSPGWTLAFGAMTVGSGLLALGTTSLCVRALVLTADGQALRVYPYGRLLGMGLGRGVTVPLKLLRENAEFAGAKRDPGSLFVHVRSGGPTGPWSPAHLIIDKPPAAAVPRLATPGSSLAFTPRGLAPASAAALKAAAAAAALPLLGPALPSAADREALRRYILLVWLLQGNCVVDMERLRAGAWGVDSIGADLGEGGLGSSRAGKAYQARVLAGQWAEAKEEGTGRVYYYNRLTWERVWELPREAQQTLT